MVYSMHAIKQCVQTQLNAGSTERSHDMATSAGSISVQSHCPKYSLGK